MTSDIKLDNLNALHDMHIAPGTLVTRYSEEDERKVVRKIDTFVLPMVRYNHYASGNLGMNSLTSFSN